MLLALLFLLSYIPPSINTVGVGSVVIVAQLAAEPFVVKYLPECVVCDGTTYTLDVLRSSVTEPEVPPPAIPVPATTAVMSPVEVNTCQEDVPPFQTYML